MPTIASVPYMNAKPLVRMFEEPGSDVRVLYDVPSKLPQLLDEGRAEAVLASSFEALQNPSRTYAEGVSIASLGDVESVRLFSKVPFAQVRTLALDSSSLTSNHLALVLLAERYGIRPSAERREPNVSSMLSQHDAAVLIGDKGMAASEAGLHVMDLGGAWGELTGLPFVWALWIGGPELSAELVAKLNEAASWGRSRVEQLARESAAATGMGYERCLRYLSQTMSYDLTERHLQGLRAYRELLVRHDYLSAGPMPRAVGATVKSRPA